MLKKPIKSSLLQFIPLVFDEAAALTVIKCPLCYCLKWPLQCCSLFWCIQGDTSLPMWVDSFALLQTGDVIDLLWRTAPQCSCPGSKEEDCCSCCASCVSAYTQSGRACPRCNRWWLLNCVGLWGTLICQSFVVTHRCCSHWCVRH